MLPKMKTAALLRWNKPHREDATFASQPDIVINVTRKQIIISTTRFSFVLLILHSTFLPLATSVQLTNLRLCNKAQVSQDYVIKTPEPCVYHETASIKHCSAKVYNPDLHLQQLTAYSCQQTTTTYSTVLYFFGAKTKEQHTAYKAAPSRKLCQEWSRTKQTGMGPLTQETPNQWLTTNKPNFRYVWPIKSIGTLQNAILTQVTILYDPIKKRISTTLASLQDCHVAKGNCLSGTHRFIWEVPKNIGCPTLTAIGEQKMLLHYNTQKKLFRLELRSLAISLHTWNLCDENTLRCLRVPTAFCDLGGLIFAPQRCTIPPKDFQSPQNFTLDRYSHVGRALNDLQDNVDSQFTRITSDFNLLECQIKRSATMTIQMLQRIYPSEVLSTMKDTNTAGLSNSDTISQLSCRTIEGKLITSLTYNGRFARRPLISYRHLDGTTRTAQMGFDGFAYDQVEALEDYVPNRVHKFVIQGVLYIFKNYTLEYENAPPTPLIMHFAKIALNFTAQDYLDTLHTFASMSSSSTDLNTLGNSIEESRHTAEEMNYFFDLANTTSSGGTGAKLSYLAKVLDNALISMISSISSPWIQGIVCLLVIQACIWGMKLTIAALTERLQQRFPNTPFEQRMANIRNRVSGWRSRLRYSARRNTNMAPLQHSKNYPTPTMPRSNTPWFVAIPLTDSVSDR